MSTDKEQLGTMPATLNNLCVQAIHYDEGDPKRIQHLIKVHDFARLIGMCEQLAPEVLFILEAAAIVHDIGIHISEQKYGSSDGKHQEQEGPAEARKLLEQIGGYTPAQIERICWLVGHHHTFKNITEADHQILIEADFLVNIDEDRIPKEHLEIIREKIFRTETGRHLLHCIYEKTYCPIKNEA